MQDIDLSVVVVRHDETIELLHGCLETIAAQTGVSLEVLVIDQGGERGVEDLVRSYGSNGSHRFSYHPVNTNSLSGCRNLGASLGSGRYIAFTDPDCRLEPGWAVNLHQALQADGVCAVGGPVILSWQGREHWVHDTLIVKERFAYLDLGPEPLNTDRIMGSNFAIDLDGQPLHELFSEGLGRDGGKLYGGEETDLCERFISRGGSVLYVPGAVVHHLIPADRMNYKALLKRVFYAGYSRSQRGGAPKPLHRIKRGRDYLALAMFLPCYAAGYAHAGLERRHSHSSSS